MNNPFSYFFARIAASATALILCGLAAIGLLFLCCCICAPAITAIGDTGGVR